MLQTMLHDEAHNYVTCSVVRVKMNIKANLHLHIYILKYAQQKAQAAQVGLTARVMRCWGLTVNTHLLINGNNVANDMIKTYTMSGTLNS